MCSFTIGCDPELVCRLNGRFVNAHNYFKSNSSFEQKAKKLHTILAEKLIKMVYLIEALSCWIDYKIKNLENSV